VIISPSLPSNGTILNNGTWASPTISIFGGLFKAAMPLLKKGAKTLGREALKTGLNIAGDVVQGRNIKQAAKSRFSQYPQTPLVSVGGTSNKSRSKFRAFA
jgi:hypothetical protein